MSLLIDGYNLLHAAGVIAGGGGPSSLARSRRALLNYVAASVDTKELAKTTVVFDAKNSPPGRPRVLRYRGITVRFAASHAEADDLIEELIQADTSPRQLTVVSSDHRLQRAARRRRASAVDSDVWCRGIRGQREQAMPPPMAADVTKPAIPLTSDEVQYWLAEFSEPRPRRRPSRHRCSEDSEIITTSRHGLETSLSAADSERAEQDNVDIANPFPPGYAEDLFE